MRKLLLMAMLLPATAGAQPATGLYISGSTGANFAGSLQSSQGNAKIDTNPGPLGVVALGWRFGNGLRTEIEGSYRSNGVSSISTQPNGALVPLGNVGGTLATYAIMANVAYDIPLHPSGTPVQPYIGVGLGYGWLNFGNAGGDGFGTFRLPENNTFTGPDHVSLGTAGAFAYQAMIGASLPVHALPGLEVTLEYRFFGTARADVPVTRVTTTGDRVNGVVPSNVTRDGFAAVDNAVMIGLRYTFGSL